MPKYLDGVKKIKPKAGVNMSKNEQADLSIDSYGEDLLPNFFNDTKKITNNLLQARRERINYKQTEKKYEAMSKREEKMFKDQERAKELEVRKQEKMAKIWQTAEEAKKIESDKKTKKLKKQRAREKLRANIMALKMQKRQKSRGFIAQQSMENIFNTKTFLQRINIFFSALVVFLLKIKNWFILVLQKIRQYLFWPVVIFIIIFFAIASLAYVLPVKNSLRQLIIYNIPVPAMIINYHPAIYASYIDEERFFSYYYLSQLEITESDKRDASKILALKNKAVFDHFLEKNILQNLADKYHIKVSSAEKQVAFEKIADGHGGIEKFTESIYNDYGLTKDMFVNNIAYYEALKIKLDEIFITDNSVHKSARMRINNVLKLLSKGNSFEELAKKYSEDDHALKGGDIGYVKINNISEGLKVAVAKLDVGMTSEILSERDRYYIVKLYDRVKTGADEEVWLKQISIFTNYSFDEYLQDLKDDAIVWNFVRYN